MKIGEIDLANHSTVIETTATTPYIHSVCSCGVVTVTMLLACNTLTVTMLQLICSFTTTLTINVIASVPHLCDFLLLLLEPIALLYLDAGFF